MNSYATTYDQADVQSRTPFLRAVYGHVAGAVLAFALLEAILLNIPAVRDGAFALMAKGRMMWLLVIGAFMAASWVASKWAHSSTSRSTQYMGLGLYIFAEALIFLPLMALLMMFDKSGNILIKAGLITTGMFVGLSSIVILSKKDFSFLRGIVTMGCFIALGAIVASALFGFSLGIVFITLMVGLMSATILFQTSNIVREYPDWAYVGAALGLFASFATLLWYVIQFLLSMASND